MVADGGFKRLHGWLNDGLETFLVDRTLNSSVRQWSVLDVETLHRKRRVVFRVCLQLTDWTEELEDGVDGMAEKLWFEVSKKVYTIPEQAYL